MTPEQIEKLQGNYHMRAPFGTPIEPARHIQTSQKVTTDTARVQLDLPKDGVVILIPAEYLKLVEASAETDRKVKKATGLYENITKQLTKMFRAMAERGVYVDGVHFLTTPYDESKELILSVENSALIGRSASIKLEFRYEK